MAFSQFEFPSGKQLSSRSKSSPTDWFELYYRFLEGCREFNEGSLPEKGWEEHHILPQCLFGEETPTIWLSYEQHCVASGYQTLAFNTCCFYGKHLQCMPDWMKPLVKIVRKRMLHINGVKVGSLPNSEKQRETAVETARAMGLANKGRVPSKDHQTKAGREGGKRLLALGKGIFGLSPEQRKENARKASLARWGKLT
jgi:hypothetical protein